MSTGRDAGTPGAGTPATTGTTGSLYSYTSATSLLHGAMSLDSVELRPDYWRLSGTSTVLYPCAAVNGSSACVGGTSAGDENEFKQEYTGSGYCAAGHTGPLCQVCEEAGTYYDIEIARCAI